MAKRRRRPGSGARDCRRRLADLGRLGLVDGPAVSRRDDGDRIGDGERAGTGSPPASWTSSWPGSRTRTRSPTCWEPASRHGANQAADEAWARVVPGSAFSHEAILARMRLFHDRGQLADAEQLINDAAEDPRNDRSDLRALLVPIYQPLGRLDEAERLIEDRWEHLNETGEGASEPAINLVRMHIELDFKPTPVETVRAYLDQAARLAPDDDRVWLGRANLAIRTGAYDEAKRWLDACLKRRPEDVPVWCAWLNWGLATNRIDVVQRALTHLPAAESTPAQIHRLNAWLSAHRGDVESERRELERLVAADPADPTALDRLAQLAQKDGQPARAAELSRKKAEIDRLRSSLRETLRSETTHSRRGGDGPPGRAARPRVRGPSLSHRGDLGRPRPRGPAARPPAAEPAVRDPP